MYNDYFGFKESPFSIAPDPRYLYMTEQHRDALAHLVYGLNSNGGCILLTGEVGTGKTTICRCLLEQIPEQANVALVMNPRLSEIELLETICDELGIAYPEGSNSVKTYTDRIYRFLIESNRNNEKTVLIIDEAQNLSSSVLEQLRLLTNLETDQHKLLQIIILGQPELLDILSRTEMRQLAQRITARFHLKPLSSEELKAYINHRLAVAGQNVQIFSENSIQLIYRMSQGVPRLINIICDRSLLGAYVENRYRVEPDIVKKASKEVFGELNNQQKKQKPWLLAAVAGLLLILLVLLLVNAPLNNNARHQGLADRDAATAAAQTALPGDSTVPDQEQESTRALPGLQTGIGTEPGTDANPATLEQMPETEVHSDESISKAGIATGDIERLLNDSDTDGLEQAYDALLSLWGIKSDGSEVSDPCSYVKAYSLNCLQKTGNMNSLMTHNRPAILTLNKQDGSNRYIVITRIRDNIAHVQFAGSEYLFDINDIDNHWYGRFTLLWHQPENYNTALSPGDSSPMIKWLSANLYKTTGTAAGSSPEYYDEQLERAVKAFQTQHGLIADGIVGPLTIIYLNTASGLAVPTLVDRPVKGS
jgi:general secretion pathway protein A